MKQAACCLLSLLALVFVPLAQALEILRWERMPLALPLHVGQERIVFVDRPIRVGMPASLGGRLRVQSAGGAIYLLANEAIEPTRLQLQDLETGQLILLDIAAEPPAEGAPALEPVRIIPTRLPSSRDVDRPDADSVPPGQLRMTAARGETPIAVSLTRYAAQNVYAPLRTIEPLPGVMRVNLRRDLDLGTLMPTLAVHAAALAAWRLEDQFVSAVRLTNTGTGWIALDPRALQGDFLTATFQHDVLGPRGTPEDTTVLYLVTRGRGLAQSLLPAIHRFDPAAHLPLPESAPRDGKEADDDAQ